MSHLYYIPSSDEIVNGDHIIRAKFYPAHTVAAHIDEYSGQEIPERQVVARLDLWLTELDVDEVSNYDGDVKGAASKSCYRYWKGYDAESFFDILKSHSIRLPVFPSEQEKKEMGVKE